jgi:hypothetical protein
MEFGVRIERLDHALTSVLGTVPSSSPLLWTAMLADDRERTGWPVEQTARREPEG